MKKFAFKIGIFAIVLCICDIALGIVFKLYDHVSGGEIHKLHSIMTKSTPDILILGSSRASHHYDSSLIGDSLGLDVFNAGFNGLGTTISYGILQGVGQRKYPKYIICEITPDYDLYGKQAPEGLNKFYPYIYIKGIQDLIDDFDKTEFYKLNSNSYKLNSSLFSLSNNLILRRQRFENGYEPLYGKLSAYKSIEWKSEPSRPINLLKKKYLKKLIDEAKFNKCEIVFTISPVYGGADISLFKDELSILDEYGVKVMNHLNDTCFINRPEYFQDTKHLNKEGAREYSIIIQNEIKSAFNL